MSLEAVEVQCPYCGETIEIEIELLDQTQSFIEDCTVCCRPIQYHVMPHEEGPEVVVSRSD